MHKQQLLLQQQTPGIWHRSAAAQRWIRPEGSQAGSQAGAPQPGRAVRRAAGQQLAAWGVGQRGDSAGVAPEDACTASQSRACLPRPGGRLG